MDKNVCILIKLNFNRRQLLRINTRECSGSVVESGGRVLDSRWRGCEFEPHRRHYVVVLEQDTFILA